MPMGKDTVTVTVQGATPVGTFVGQQEVSVINTLLTESFTYDGNGKIIQISSNYYPLRKILYANNKISSIEYWFGDPTTSVYKGQTDNFEYDQSRNVIIINQTDHSTNVTFLFAEYT